MDSTTLSDIAPPSFHPALELLLGRLKWMLAEAKAEQGDIAAARQLIATTPLDCYDCVRTRGKIEAAARNWNRAAFWFARATHDAPSIPQGLSDWGAMLMAKGDEDAAIGKFREANAKGPHFADPLEMWGEALITKNRSDLAVAKFEEANRYAPNWGRLHLKWGEALYWNGDRAAAHREFAKASALDLMSSEKSELARMERIDGG